MTDRKMTSTRAVLALTCLAVLVCMPVTQSAARSRLTDRNSVTLRPVATTQDADQASKARPLSSSAAGSFRRQAGDTLPPVPLSPQGCGSATYNNGAFDGVNGLASELNTTITDARTADDIVFSGPVTICAIRAILLTTVVPETATVEIYADSGGSGPVNAAPIATYPSTGFTNIGSAFGLPLLQFTFTVPSLDLAAGKYWICPVATDGGSGRGFFATTGNGALTNQGGYFKSTFFSQPVWAPVTTQIANSDFAFAVDYSDQTGACTLTCPGDQNVPAFDMMGAVVNYPPPTTGGACGPITCVPPSGSQFPLGTTEVTCTAPDQVPSRPDGIVQTTYSSGNIAVPIPDNNPAGATSVINIADPGTVTDIEVHLRLNHTFDSDLAITLTGPNAAVVDLSSGNGGSGDNYGSGNLDCSGTPTVFDDQAMTSITSGTAPFAGTFIPEQALGGFNGIPAAGAWTLKVVDSAALDTGTIGCYELVVTRDITGGGGGAQCSFNVTVSIPFDSCCIDDGTGDTFRQVVTMAPPGSPLYGLWEYHVAATNETFTGTANIVSYRPGLSIVMDDTVTVNYGMHAEIDFPRKKCRVQVVERPTNRHFVLRDRDITNNMCAPAPPPPPPQVVKNE